MKSRGISALFVACFATASLALTAFAAPAQTWADAGSDAASASEIADVIARGLSAEARGDADALVQEARTLTRLSRPAAGETDLARRWLQEARALGAKVEDDDVWRGRTLGPAYKSGRVGAHGQFQTRQTFTAGIRAEIAIVPKSDDPLSLAVNDDEGASICEIAPSARNLGCRWVPPFTGASHIEIGNDNDRPVEFYIVLN